MTQQNKSEFEQLDTKRSGGLISDLLGFLKENKKWWLLPIVVIMLLITALVILVGTGAAPFIYTLF